MFSFIVGAVVGSFLNVVIDRSPKNKSIAFSRSRCESCNKNLYWYDLIPIVSYLLLMGKCRFCKKKIPSRIIFVEILTGSLYALLAYLFLPFNLLLFVFLGVIFSVLLVIFYIDMYYGIIPDFTLVIILIVSLIYYLISSPASIPASLISAVSLFLFFLLLFIITGQKGIGFGDVKFAFVIGFLLSYPGSVFAVYSAFLTGAVVSIILILNGRKKFKKGEAIAFGPFLVLGIALYYTFQDKILKVFHGFGL